jgi:hypothetical protein
MKRIRSWGLAVVVLMLVFGLALAIQAQSPLQIAAVQNGAPVLADTSGAIQPLPVPPGRDIFAIAWSPDGQRLALVVNDESYTPQLFVTSPDMAEMIALDAGPLESGFGAAFTPDGQILYAAQGVFPADFSAPPMVEIRQIAPEAGAQPASSHTSLAASAARPFQPTGSCGRKVASAAAICRCSGHRSASCTAPLAVAAQPRSSTLRPAKTGRWGPPSISKI